MGLYLFLIVELCVRTNLNHELNNSSLDGIDVYVTPNVFVSRTQNVLGEKGRRIRELTAVVQKRFGFPEGSVEVRKTG